MVVLVLPFLYDSNATFSVESDCTVTQLASLDHNEEGPTTRKDTA